LRGLTRKIAALCLVLGCWFIAIGEAGSADAASPDQAPPIPAGQARVWFLRQLSPGTDWDAPMIYANRVPLAISPQQSAFYRDFMPGPYVFSVENCLPERQASYQVNLTPGDQIALEVQSDDNDSDAECELGSTSYLRPPAAQDLADIFGPLHYLGRNIH
jgi:hypothetical protein